VLSEVISSRRVRWWLAAACAALLLGWTTSADSTTYVLTDGQRLLSASDVVVLGTVEHTESMWRGKRIVTRAVVRVDDLAKGATAERIEVLAPGGTVDGVRMRVIGVPQLRVGDQSVLFLRGALSAYRVVGLSQGKLDVFRDDDGTPLVRWIPPGETRLRTQPLEKALRSLRAAATNNARGNNAQ
jgi:hypothetical protein